MSFLPDTHVLLSVMKYPFRASAFFKVAIMNVLVTTYHFPAGSTPAGFHMAISFLWVPELSPREQKTADALAILS
jgi:hypothetical protein